MSTIERILDNYNRLCAYCDDFYSSMRSRYAADMRCRRGCSTCCGLHSVCALEAHVITRNIVDVTLLRQALPVRRGKSGCAMLMQNKCAVYGSRPVICRTHGLVISIDNRETACSSCDLNFAQRDIQALPKRHVFDAAAITANLMRLNLAFCIAIGRRVLASKRFTIEHVLSGDLPKSIL